MYLFKTGDCELKINRNQNFNQITIEGDVIDPFRYISYLKTNLFGTNFEVFGARFRKKRLT